MIKKLFIMVLILNVLVSSFGCNLERKLEPTIKTSVSQLIADYEENESIADKRYEGKTLLISGNITHSALIRDTIGINLKTDDPQSQWAVMCLINRVSQPDAASKIKAGKDVTFIGISHRVENESFIRIEDCRFAE